MKTGGTLSNKGEVNISAMGECVHSAEIGGNVRNFESKATKISRNREICSETGEI